MAKKNGDKLVERFRELVRKYGMDSVQVRSFRKNHATNKAVMIEAVSLKNTVVTHRSTVRQ